MQAGKGLVKLPALFCRFKGLYRKRGQDTPAPFSLLMLDRSSHAPAGVAPLHALENTHAMIHCADNYSKGNKMTMPKYNVVLNGKILPQADRTQVLSRMQERFHIDARKAERLLQNTPKAIKKGLDEQAAEKFAKALKQIGLDCELERQDTQDLGELKMEKEQPPVAAATAACPKCNYPFEYENVVECPNCNIIVEKYLALQESPDIQDQPEDPPEEASAAPLQNDDAPWSARSCAGVASIVVTGALVNFICLIAAVIFYFKFHSVLTQPISSNGSYAANQVFKTMELYDIVAFAAGVIVTLFYYVVGPIRKGGTWAQRFTDLIIVSIHTGEKPNWLAWPLRAIGSFITFVGGIIVVSLWFTVSMIPLFLLAKTYLLAGIVLTVIILFAGLYLLRKLIKWMIRTNHRSLADRFSQTRQFRRNQAVATGLSGLWVVIIVIGLFSAGFGAMARSLITPPSRQAVDKQIEETRNVVDIKILERTHEFQNQYLAKHGTYNDDPKIFAMEYCNPRSMRDIPYIDAAIKERLLITLTETGYQAELEIKDHPGYYHVYTEVGYQGIETYEETYEAEE